MRKLWLVFKDEEGEEKRVEVDRTPFTVGRHSECDLTILDGLLSREHLRIERQADKFLASDTRSSNGTTLNGEKLTDPIGLKNEDALNLGGGIKIAVEIEEIAEPDNAPAAEPPQPAGADAPSVGDAASASAPSASAGVPSASVAGSSGGGGIPMAFFFIAPLLGIFVLAAVIGAIVLFGGDRREVTSNSGEYGQTEGDDNDIPAGDDGNEDDDTPKPIKSSTPVSSGTPPLNGPAATPPPPFGGIDLPPTGDGETAKVERNGAAFLRQAALNDQKAFLTTEQAAAVSATVKRVGKSSALADNINSARKNASAIKTLAASKNLKPQFLAVAALTKLGGSRGDVLQTAQSVVDVYDKLAIHISNENSDDILLLVAAYDQGAAGDFMKMRNMLQQLATKTNVGPRELRSIWYLEKSGNMAKADYERALNFLAIGTIAQNPKEFGVNAEALSL
jgi:pSer/pThr/pTyr-binding forkhead associated (FHA) protein